MQDVLLRKRKDGLMTPLAREFFASVHPNYLSVAALVVGLMSVAAIVSQLLVLGFALWILNRGLDGLDGVVARVHHKQSDFGAYLDLLLDFGTYLAIPLAFIWIAPTELNMWAGLALLSAYVLNLLSWTTLSALVEKRGLGQSARLTGIEMPVGLIEGAETIFFYSLFYLLPQHIGMLFATLAGLVFLTAGQRVYWAYRNLAN